MHESIEKFFEKQKKTIQENRKQFLIDNNICERVYNPSEDSEYSDEYPYRDRDTGKWFKKEPIDVTDEFLDKGGLTYLFKTVNRRTKPFAERFLLYDLRQLYFRIFRQ